MLFSLSDESIFQFVGQYFLPFIRISAFFLAAPIFGTRIVSMRIRLVLGLAIAILVAPLLPDLPKVEAITLSVWIIVIQQLVIGLSFAFVFQVVFQVFVLAGQFVAMKMGLGFAQMNDPANGVSVTIISQFYLLTITLLFLSVNGHLLLIEFIVHSFSMIPIGGQGLFAIQFNDITALGGWMFASALSIALPLLTALLIVNIAFGIISRAAPQINIFAVGFPFTLVFGLFLVWVGLSDFITLFSQVTEQGFQYAEQVLRKSNG